MAHFTLSQAALQARAVPGVYRLSVPGGRVYAGRATNVLQRMRTYYWYARVLGCGPTAIRVYVRYMPGAQPAQLVARERQLIRVVERGAARRGQRVMNYDREREGEFFG